MNPDQPASNVQQQIAVELDKALLGVLVNGVVVQDENGKPVTITPSAAMFNAINARLKLLRVQSPAVAGSAAGGLLAEAERRGMRFNGEDVTPPLDADGEDAATA